MQFYSEPTIYQQVSALHTYITLHSQCRTKDATTIKTLLVPSMGR